MNNKGTLTTKDLAGLVASIIARNGSVVAPTNDEGRHRFAVIRDAGLFAMPQVNTVNSIKEFFFPSSEEILGYRRTGADTQVTDTARSKLDFFVIFGARPCDAASLEIMDQLFNWDTVDSGWQTRRDAATVITVACARMDAYCFCTSVGLAPDSRKGSDLLLIPASGASYIAEPLTQKGRTFVELHAQCFAPGDSTPAPLAAVPRRIDVDTARRWLQENFESPLWTSASSRCLGCGVCTYCCPTCHCFDIQDESDGGAGARFKVWDSCSFDLFTRHTSGHNPRPDRPSRWRQRIMHKFFYYPDRFGVVSCTGCGRCGRLCPVDLGVEETLRAIPGGPI